MHVSISSIAQESALRLGPVSTRAASREAVAQRSAEATAQAIAGGATPSEATVQGAEAGKEIAPQATGASVNSNVLSQLVKYVPTESITIYVAVLAALGDVKAPDGEKIDKADFSNLWLVTALLALATLSMTVGLAYRAQKNADAQASFKLPVFDVLAATFAFAVWALSLPSTPLRDIEGYEYSSWNPVIILLGTAAISFVAYVLNKNVAWEKFLQDGQ